MSRTGVEEKIPWRRVPKVVRQQVEDALGARVVRAARIWGGYSPTPTFRLALADERRAFFKAINGDSNEFATHALHVEERVYRELGDLLQAWMPTHYATLHVADWYILLLEDLGPKSAPPWTPALTRGVAHALGHFHRSTLGTELPAWCARPTQNLAGETWQRVIDESHDYQQIAEMAGDAAGEARAWLHTAAPILTEILAQPALQQEPYSLLHGDLRSDNLRFNQGRLYLFDWPAITVGRAEWDTVVFAQTVTVEGGVAPEQVMAWYGEIFPVDAAAVECALAFWLTFFARRACREEIPGLPRLRRFQRQQLAVLVQWAARQWSLPAPTWTATLLT